MPSGGVDGHPKGDPEARLPEVASERFEAARAEEEVRSQLEYERARSVALERQLETLRSSESFRVGHALVEGVVGRFRWNVLAMPRAAFRRARRGRIGATNVKGKSWRSSGGSNTVLFVAWGVDDAKLDELLERVERLQAMLVDVHPVFVVDSMTVEPIRRRGYPIEYIVPLGEWREHRPPHEWGPYVTGRMAALRSHHGPSAVVVFEGASPISALDQGVINPILLPQLGASEDNRLD